ncbi:rhodanese-like domain-containing protein [candidate division WS5 bacterium]|uniref:Rhodanese-like domain-containing protein n=1 Tax=candidate division WS5 bacterium TaxID=2093353 RepID=A0A419DBT5_9BACT|nr:MAG: rhodanese-like domain-containing protein [candidate division WS5 bacterium]
MVYMAIKNITSNEFKEMLDENPEDLEIIDVREPDEYAAVRVHNSKLIPLSTIPMRINEIDWSKKVILVCKSGARSSHIAKLLSNAGKDVHNLTGGVYELDANNCPCLEKSD